MKKILIAIGAAVIGYAALAQTNDYSIRQLRDPVQLQTKLNNDIAAIASRVGTAESLDSQVDTNATTSVTTITPARIGQVLFGKVGGSNAIWRASAATTNGWVKVLQAQ